MNKTYCSCFYILLIVGILFSSWYDSSKTNMSDNPVKVNNYVNIVNIKHTLVDTISLPEILNSELMISAVYEDIAKEMEKLLYPQTDTLKPVIKETIKYNGKYRISETGKAFIKKYESCKLTRYMLKGERYYTIGWGHQIKPGEGIPARITQEYADELFDKDIVWVNDACNRLIKQLNPNMKITQGFVDGLCSLIYNCGERGASNTKFFKRLKNCRFNNGVINKDDYNFALEGIKTSNVFMKGHIARRNGEYNLVKG